MIGGELRGQFVRANSSGDRESAQIIERIRRDVVGEAVIELIRRFLHLLAKEMESRERFGARFVGINFNVVTDCFRGPESENAASGQQFLRSNSIEQLLRVIEQFP